MDAEAPGFRPLSRLGDVTKGDFWRDPQRVTHIAREFRAVKRIKMQPINAAVEQITAQFSAKCCCQQILPAIPQRGFKRILYPGRYMRATAFGKGKGPGPVFNRQDTGKNGRIYSGLVTRVAKAKEGFCFKEELGDRLCGACIDLAFQPLHAGIQIRRLWVRIWIGAYADREISGVGKRFDQFNGISKAIRVGHET